MTTYADRYAERVAEAEDWMAQKRTRAEQLTALAAERVKTMPATIGGHPVTVEVVAYAAIVADTIRRDMESGRAKAVAEATMYGLGALVEAIAPTLFHPAPSTHTTRE